MGVGAVEVKWSELYERGEKAARDRICEETEHETLALQILRHAMPQFLQVQKRSLRLQRQRARI